MPRFEFSINEYLPESLRFTNQLVREAFSEFACTTLFLAAGVGCVIQIKTGSGDFGSFLSLNMAWGFAVMFGSGLGIGLSGGHMNPAVTFAQWILGRKFFLQVIVYAPAQVLGAMFGTALAYTNYIGALNAFDGGDRMARGTNGTLCFLVTCPAPYESQWGGILDQVMGTGILITVMCSMIDSRNQVPMFLHPLFGGLSVMMIGMCYGVNDGYPINPARDFGARMFATLVYGSSAFSDSSYWFWVPLVGPMLGSIAGVIFYNFLFDFHTPKEKEMDEKQLFKENFC